MRQEKGAEGPKRQSPSFDVWTKGGALFAWQRKWTYDTFPCVRFTFFSDLDIIKGILRSEENVLVENIRNRNRANRI